MCLFLYPPAELPEKLLYQGQEQENLFLWNTPDGGKASPSVTTEGAGRKNRKKHPQREKNKKSRKKKKVTDGDADNLQLPVFPEKKAHQSKQKKNYNLTDGLFSPAPSFPAPWQSPGQSVKSGHPWDWVLVRHSCHIWQVPVKAGTRAKRIDHKTLKAQRKGERRKRKTGKKQPVFSWRRLYSTVEHSVLKKGC